MNEVQSRIRVLLDTDLEDNPRCIHGPMLKFSRENEKGVRTDFFACSACRSRRECPGAIVGTEEEYHDSNLKTHKEIYANAKKVCEFLIKTRSVDLFSFLPGIPEILLFLV